MEGMEAVELEPVLIEAVKLPKILVVDVAKFVELMTDVLSKVDGPPLIEVCDVETVWPEEEDEAVLLWLDDDDPLEGLDTGALDEIVEVVPPGIDKVGRDSVGLSTAGVVEDVDVVEDGLVEDVGNDELDAVSPFALVDVLELSEVEAVGDNEVSEEVGPEGIPRAVDDWLLDVVDVEIVDELKDGEDTSDVVIELALRVREVGIVNDKVGEVKNEVVCTVFVVVHVYAGIHYQFGPVSWASRKRLHLQVTVVVTVTVTGHDTV
ncbi:MAG: hypothetical protein Q9168_004819 [Polycauliona sp. 1 TL-2023]